MEAHSKMLQEIPQMGEIIGGKYRLERVVGTGGMGVVCESTHVDLGEKVAIKFLAGEAAASEERVVRFVREAWAAAKIKSEHVARVIDVARLADGNAYLVMEYLEGEDIKQVLARGPMPVCDAVDFILQACEALVEAHKLGIVHRDLKPGNLFVTTRADGLPWIKVLDFGISKIAGGAITKTSTLMGSPLYMSPEQLVSAKHVDPRADIWSLGVILYEMLSGATPFTADTLPQIIACVMHNEPRPLRELASDVPAEIEQALGRCLQKDPAERHQSLADLATALAPFGSQRARASAEYIANVIARPLVDSPGGPVCSRDESSSQPVPITLLSEPRLTVDVSDDQAASPSAAPHSGEPAARPGSPPEMPQATAALADGPTRTMEPLSASPPARRRTPVAVVVLTAVSMGVLIGVVALFGRGDDDALAPSSAGTAVVGQEPPLPASKHRSDPSPEPESSAVQTAVGEPHPSASATGTASSAATASASSVAPKSAPPRQRTRQKAWDPWEGR